MSRAFVIHLHSGHGPEHYDLMVEDGDALATWQLLSLPAPDGAPLEARRLPDHRRAYLTYEGPVSRDRGEVRCVDRGDCNVATRSEDQWDVQFAGQTLRGAWRLRRLQDDRWSLESIAPA